MYLENTKLLPSVFLTVLSNDTSFKSELPFVTSLDLVVTTSVVSTYLFKVNILLRKISDIGLVSIVES